MWIPALTWTKSRLRILVVTRMIPLNFELKTFDISTKLDIRSLDHISWLLSQYHNIPHSKLGWAVVSTTPQPISTGPIDN